MADESRKDWKRGDVLSHHAFNDFDERLKALEGIRGGAGLSVRRGKRGAQITGTGDKRFYIGLSNGSITARSGTTPGAGTVTVKYFDGSVIADAGLSVDVLHLNTVAIATGKYCAVQEDAFGTLWVAPLEC